MYWSSAASLELALKMVDLGFVAVEKVELADAAMRCSW